MIKNPGPQKCIGKEKINIPKCFSEFCEPLQQINGTQGEGHRNLRFTAHQTEGEVTTWTRHLNLAGEGSSFVGLSP